jgi:hypothetical protein
MWVVHCAMCIVHSEWIAYLVTGLYIYGDIETIAYLGSHKANFSVAAADC